jgi:hypothetical protein
LFSCTAGLVNRFCDVAAESCLAGLVNVFLYSGGELFSGTPGLVNGLCDVAGEICLAVQLDWLMGFVM